MCVASGKEGSGLRKEELEEEERGEKGGGDPASESCSPHFALQSGHALMEPVNARVMASDGCQKISMDRLIDDDDALPSVRIF